MCQDLDLDVFFEKELPPNSINELVLSSQYFSLKTLEIIPLKLDNLITFSLTDDCLDEYRGSWEAAATQVAKNVIIIEG